MSCAGFGSVTFRKVPLRALRVARSAPTSEPVRMITKGGADCTVPIVEEIWPFVVSRWMVRRLRPAVYELDGSPSQWLGVEAACALRTGGTDEACARTSTHSGYSLAVEWCSARTVQAWLGHSSATLTLDTYSHFLPSSENKSGWDHMNRVLGTRQGHSGRVGAGVVETVDPTSGLACAHTA